MNPAKRKQRAKAKAGANRLAPKVSTSAVHHNYGKRRTFVVGEHSNPAFQPHNQTLRGE